MTSHSRRSTGIHNETTDVCLAASVEGPCRLSVTLSHLSATLKLNKVVANVISNLGALPAATSQRPIVLLHW